MSKTFAPNSKSKPSLLSSRSQSQPKGRGRGAVNPPAAGGMSRSVLTGVSRGSELARGGSKPIGNKGGHQFGVAGRGSANRSVQAQARGGHFETPGGRMNPHQSAGGLGDGNLRSPEKPENSDPSLEQEGQYAGGFTVFAPNEQRRQQISQMAQKETRAYEQFKKRNSSQTFNYVGSVGGGELSQDQARNRQANAVRAQRFNRQVRQSEMREERRKAEDQEIEAKRIQARQKAERNSQRQDRVAPADEVRRKREAFLQQLENMSPTAQPTSAQPATLPSPTFPPSRGPASPLRNASRPHQAASSTPSGQSANNRVCHSETRVKREPEWPTQVKTEVRAGSEHNVPASSQSWEELDMLFGMFPGLDKDYLADLLQQMGSVDSVIGLLNGD